MDNTCIIRLKVFLKTLIRLTPTFHYHIYLENYLSETGKWYENKAFGENKPGQLFEYSNVGSTLAAYIIEIVSNQTYAEFTTENILKPLQMNNSGWQL